MAAPIKYGKIISRKFITDDAIEVKMTMEDFDLGFIGGQYIIINTELPLSENKTIKRAYSIISSDEDQKEITLAIKPILDGLGSPFFKEVSKERILPFGGPYGRLKYENTNSPQCKKLVLATDTGITAALGLLKGKDFKDHLPNTTLVWIAENESYFITLPKLRELLPKELHEMRFFKATSSFDPKRVVEDRFFSFLDGKKFGYLLASGDGSIIEPIKNRFVENEISPENIKMEYFFNRPK